MAKTLIFIATYNERENIEPMHARLKRLDLGADILFLDDNSPDGTGQAAKRLADGDPAVSVIHRAGKEGIGGAHLAGIRWAYDRGYEMLITMDCDFTHQPEDIPVFRKHADGVDVVIGTRFADPRSLKDWDPFRRAVTFLGHFLTQRLLGIPYDASGAFRLYRLKNIPPALFDLVTSKGYDFFFESLYILFLNGYSIREIPILLPARTCGHSKMAPKDALTGFSRLLYTCVRARLKGEKYSLRQ